MQRLARVVGEPSGALAVTLILLVLAGAIFAPVLTGYHPTAIALRYRFLDPSLAHPLGTDQLGRDLFSRVLFGGRTAFFVAFGSIAASLIAGILTGLAAGYGPRWLDGTMLLLFDATKSFPTVMLALVLVTVIGPSIWAVMLVVLVTTAPAYGRLVRTQTIGLRHADYILAERSLGAGAARIVFLHIMPNLIGTLLILASMDIPSVVGIEAGMSFLGLGVRPPTPSWGSILNDGFSYIRESPWPAVAGGLPIIVITLGFTFLGERLRDVFDPRLSWRRT